jgi:chromate transporter
MSETDTGHSNTPRTGSVAEVFLAFLKLGVSSFGGPSAHLAYFRTEFVERRGWLDDRAYSDLVALCQFLPGPASSQVGFALGLRRARWAGAFAAWAAFTLPSALLLILFATGITQVEAIAASGAVHGLKLAAVAIVAHATWGMARSLCPDWTRTLIAIIAAGIVLASSSTGAQLIAIAVGGLFAVGALRMPPVLFPPQDVYPVSRRTGFILLTVFALLLALLPTLGSASGQPALILLGESYRSGALVFGGGHVVLPALHASLVAPGWISEQSFLAGYGAAQAVPGPLFAFGAYLGAIMLGWAGGLLALAAIFGPGLLLVVGILPFWQSLQRHPRLRAAMAGASAAVVGVLAATLYDPLWTGSVHSGVDVAVVAAGALLLFTKRASPLVVVVACALAGPFLAPNL